ncbi:hypothetical protein Pmani_027322 [Petrolisthes manimaculis]|uniref:Uncharacterized protein n=1 Tax=Petrolisthes manimaculis TaxID=1843537 RepID=A0AAE1P2D9_9EUCA|nr:hypothetical protein Pmani_027322 [Petrolisthes manimaculis]
MRGQKVLLSVVWAKFPSHHLTQEGRVRRDNKGHGSPHDKLTNVDKFVGGSGGGGDRQDTHAGKEEDGQTDHGDEEDEQTADKQDGQTGDKQDGQTGDKEDGQIEEEEKRNYRQRDTKERRN